MDEEETLDEDNDSMSMDLIYALEPHQNLQSLEIQHFVGSKLPDWITLSLNHLTSIEFDDFNRVALLPPLGILPYLEELMISQMLELQFVGREFLFGITAAIATTSVIGFPKLKKLTFDKCPKWKKWEDITTEEEDSATVFVMPCLTELSINDCTSLITLPQRLLRKASLLLEKLDIREIDQLGMRELNPDEESAVSMDAQIKNQSKYLGWIRTSPLNHLRSVNLACFYHMLSLPPLGILPRLEELRVYAMNKLQFVGWDFLGITTTTFVNTENFMDINHAPSSSSSSSSSSATTFAGFPKLKILVFAECGNWKEWEDIAAQDEDSNCMILMPCLRELYIYNCSGLAALPHRLLRKASSLEKLDISGSRQLERLYSNEEGSAWKSISRINSRLQLWVSFRS